ncbi:substrate-binding domain-containing protein [bacterium]|nr:substrate-binding domain-containing protein [bacterium]
MKRKISYIFFAICVVIFAVVGCPNRSTYLKIATTVGVKNSGVIDILISSFEDKYNVKVVVVSVGTDQSLEMSKSGDADLIIVRNSSELEQFKADGYAYRSRSLMANHYVIVGPKDDPAGLANMDAISAIEKLSAQNQYKYLTRGWGSGVYSKDLILLDKSEVEKGPWYKKTGETVEGILLSASQSGAYTMADMATFVRLKDKLNLKPVVEKDPLLINSYSIVVISPDKVKDVKSKLANTFFEYACSNEGKKNLKEFGQKKYSKPLFTNICE